MAKTTVKDKKSNTVKPKGSAAEKAAQDKAKNAVKVKSPIVFRDTNYSVQYHDIKIFVQGVEVTPFVSGSIKVDFSLNGHSQASFTLDNAGDKFTLTEENLKDWDVSSIYNATGIFEYRKKVIANNIQSNKDQHNINNDIAHSGYSGSKVDPSSGKTKNGAVVAANQEKATSKNKVQSYIEGTNSVLSIDDSYSELPKAKIYAFKMGRMFSDVIKYTTELVSIIDKEELIYKNYQNKQPDIPQPTPPDVTKLPPFDVIWPTVKDKRFDSLTSLTIASNVPGKESKINDFMTLLFAGFHEYYIRQDTEQKQQHLAQIEKDFNKTAKELGIKVRPFDEYREVFLNSYVKNEQYNTAYGDYLQKLADYEKAVADRANAKAYDETYVKGNDVLALYADDTLNLKNKIVLFVYSVLKKMPTSAKSLIAFNAIKATLIDKIKVIFNTNKEQDAIVESAVNIAYNKSSTLGRTRPTGTQVDNYVNFNKRSEDINPVDTETGEQMWSFGVGKTVFHKNDTIRIFVHNPYSDYYKDEWLPKFTGFLDSATVTLDHINGGSSITLTCVDFRKLLSRMRVQMRPRMHQKHELIVRQQILRSGFFKDLYWDDNSFRWSTVFKNKSLLQVFQYLLTNQRFRVGRVRNGFVVRYPTVKRPIETQTYEITYLENKADFVKKVKENIIKQEENVKTYIKNIGNSLSLLKDIGNKENPKFTYKEAHYKLYELANTRYDELLNNGQSVNNDPLYTVMSEYTAIIEDAFAYVSMAAEYQGLKDKLAELETAEKSIISKPGELDVTALNETILKKNETLKQIERFKDYEKKNSAYQVKIQSISDKIAKYQSTLTTKIKKYENELKDIITKIDKYKKDKADRESKFKELDKDRRLLEQWHLLTILGVLPKTQDELLSGSPATLSSSLLETQFRFLKESDVDTIGRLSYWRGPWSPDNVFFHALLPPANGTLQNLTTYQYDPGVPTIDWGFRAALLDNYAQIVDYKWYVTPMGDIVLEFPMYDFYPEDFGKNLENVFKADHGLISNTYADESGDFPTALTLYGGIANKHVDSNSTMPEDFKIRVWAWSPLLQQRVGTVEISKAFDFIFDFGILTRLALIHLQKEINNANSMQLSIVSKEFLMLNRPFFSLHDMRMGHIDTLSWSYTIDGDEDMSLSLDQVRTLRTDFSFRFISGGPSLPISFRDFYGIKSIGSQGHYKGISWAQLSQRISFKPRDIRLSDAAGGVNRKKLSKTLTASQFSVDSCDDLRNIYNKTKKISFKFPQVPLYGNGAKIANARVICGYGGPSDMNVAFTDSYINFDANYGKDNAAQLCALCSQTSYSKKTLSKYCDEIYTIASKKPPGNKLLEEKNLPADIAKYKSRLKSLTFGDVANNIKSYQTIVNAVGSSISCDPATPSALMSVKSVFLDLLNDGLALFYYFRKAPYPVIDRRIAPETAYYLSTPKNAPITSNDKEFYNDIINYRGGASEDFNSYDNDYIMCINDPNQTFSKRIYPLIQQNMLTVIQLPDFSSFYGLALDYRKLDKKDSNAVTSFLNRKQNGAPLKYNFYFLCSLLLQGDTSVVVKDLAARAFFRSRLCVLTPTTGKDKDKIYSVFRIAEYRKRREKALELSYNGCWALGGGGTKVVPSTVDAVYYVRPTDISGIDSDLSYLKALLHPTTFDAYGITWVQSPVEYSNATCGPCAGSVFSTSSPAGSTGVLKDNILNATDLGLLSQVGVKTPQDRNKK